MIKFLVDICDHLTVLNLSLQCKNILIPNAISKISAFKSKLASYRAQIKNYKFMTFIIFKNFKCKIPNSFSSIGIGCSEPK